MKKILLLLLAAMTMLTACEKTVKSGFAVVIDPQSYEQARAEIDAYVETVRARGLEPVLVIDEWGVPDSLRARLYELYTAKANPIEGAVFIGDIPVAMVRDAQHMTTAFKMDQDAEFGRDEYSVPTDRFYDDFDLQFRYLDHDTARAEYWYYSLKAEGAQKLEPEIYTARIFPRTNEGGDKYEKLRRYMQRVNAADEVNTPIDQILFFSGHGFISESVDARIDEKIELYDQFPWLKQQQQGIEYIDHKREDFVKTRLIQQMQYDNLDFAVMHHHGDCAVQYLSGDPDAATFAEAVEEIKAYVRHQMAHGTKKGMSKKEIMQRVNKYAGATLPEAWYNEGLDPAHIEADEQTNEELSHKEQLWPVDFKDYHPQARFVILDACYNGSFHKDESIQECYLFGEGNGTLVVMGNSVNVLQDKWVNRYVGLLGLGMRAGYMAKFQPYLEAHVFGDPTYAFAPAGDCGFDINQALISEDDAFWEKQLQNDYPAIQILALEQLADSERNWSDRIFRHFRESQYGIVRLAAMLCLAEYDDQNFTDCVALALGDGHEMTQRFAVNLAGDMGDEELCLPMVKLASKNNTSERIEFDLSSALRCYDSTLVEKTFDDYFPTMTCYCHPDSIGEVIRHALHSYTTTIVGEIEDVVYDTARKERGRVMYARMLRNTNLHQSVPGVLEYLSTPDTANVKLQTVLWEALGWFNLSYRKEEIASKAEEVSADTQFNDTVRSEALKTYHRLGY